MKTKINVLEELKDHKFIVIGYEHFNPLGVIRSLGEEGLAPYFIVKRNSELKIASKSKYVSAK